MFQPARITRLCLPILLPLVLGAKFEAQTQNRDLMELQQAYAMRFLEPEPHMALAKYYFDHGKPLEAFHILEAARRNRFEEKIFNLAFYRAFDGFDNSKAAEDRLLDEYARNPNSVETIDRLADIYISRENWPRAKQFLLIAIQKKPDNYRFVAGLAEVLSREGKLEEADKLENDYLKKYPESAMGYAMRAEGIMKTKPLEARALLAEAIKRYPNEGQLLFDLGTIYQSENKQKAEEAFVKAAELAPRSALIQSWVGRFFFKVKPDDRRALRYYLNAYFLDPHAYETEYVESRISKIDLRLAAARFDEQTKAGVSLVGLLDDPNPIVVGLALEQMEAKWLPSFVGPVVHLMEHEAQGVRWMATQALKKNVDQSFDEQLKALLKDEDPRKRGLAAYIAVYRWKKDSFGIIKSLLSEESQLVRFDALSALLIEGGVEGRQVALEHAAHESNETLKKLINAEEQRQ
jgi:tetratricopeptide (TPR) repeat protein